MKGREGRLLFAGADISISMGGLLEGAVLSGGVAAAEAIEFLNADGPSQIEEEEQITETTTITNRT